MRKDVILGMSIGGVMLAVVIVYLTVSPSGKSNKNQAQLESAYGDVTGGAGDVGGAGRGDLAETPITPAAPQDAKAAKPPADKDAPAGKKPAAPKKDDATKLASSNEGGVVVRTADDKKPAIPAAADDKPQVLAATSTEKSDPKWGSLLWGQQATPLIGTSETPDPNAATAAAMEAKGDQSAVSKRNPIVVPGVTAEKAKVAPTSTTAKDVAAVAKTGAAAKGARQHTVTQGETFSTIAQAVYGSPTYYPFILRANPQIDPKKLKPGMVINLPDPNDVKPTEAPEKAAATPGATPAAHKIEASTVDPKSEYKVQAGDSLNKIATKLYGRLDMVQKIYELNKTAIGTDPAKLKLGMVLKLPEAPTATAGR